MTFLKKNLPIVLFFIKIILKLKYFKLKWMNEQKIINDVLRYTLDLLEKVNHYPYHNINHTLDVYARAEYLCDKEFIHLQDKTDVLIWALFHDTGFTVQYNSNEIIWAKIAREYLEKINFDKDRINKIEKIILATIVWATPNDKLEEIIQDADFDNLWRKDSMTKTLKYRKERILILKEKINLKEWFISTHNLFRWHKFHTSTSIIEREQTKKENIKKLEDKITILEIKEKGVLSK